MFSSSFELNFQKFELDSSHYSSELELKPNFVNPSSNRALTELFRGWLDSFAALAKIIGYGLHWAGIEVGTKQFRGSSTERGGLLEN